MIEAGIKTCLFFLQCLQIMPQRIGADMDRLIFIFTVLKIIGFNSSLIAMGKYDITTKKDQEYLAATQALIMCRFQIKNKESSTVLPPPLANIVHGYLLPKLIPDRRIKLAKTDEEFGFNCNKDDKSGLDPACVNKVARRMAQDEPPRLSNIGTTPAGYPLLMFKVGTHSNRWNPINDFNKNKFLIIDTQKLSKDPTVIPEGEVIDDALSMRSLADNTVEVVMQDAIYVVDHETGEELGKHKFGSDYDNKRMHAQCNAEWILDDPEKRLAVCNEEIWLIDTTKKGNPCEELLYRHDKRIEFMNLSPDKSFLAIQGYDDVWVSIFEINKLGFLLESFLKNTH